ncbi:protease inhibitor I42 family protein [Clostridium cellulovorans]|uniref:Proteinase inhibitor I42, chagasin n=2 Tax=Clostridium cellulovorans TaxID=1493 RepID=D9SNR5_CLOC7|nr:protease inhibitor I42 family protein [Clostridium cellulovorans]ADL49936.1 Proteinase inhibitor I42, chagasin [Clostridium cellulovorans 743B]BAV13054.1 cell wall binding repeat domain protein [Clostridium cellulovorans]
MLKKKRTFISKILLVSMCASIVPATVALAGENAVVKKSKSNEIQIIPMPGNVKESTSISLKSNATTGYSWKYTVVQGDSIIQTLKSYRPDDTSGTIDGSGGTDTWTFKGSKEGSTTLRFEYSRSWEESPVDTREFIITVDGDMNMTVKETTKGTASIQLRSDTTTEACSWRYSVVQGDSIVESSKEFIEYPVWTGIYGSGGRNIWVFKGLKEGSTTLKFEYLRPTEGDVAEIRDFNLTVDKDLNVSVTELSDQSKAGPSSQRVADINGDGNVNLIDLALLKKYLKDNTIGISKYVGDLNRDGQINSTDVNLLKMALLR